MNRVGIIYYLKCPIVNNKKVTCKENGKYDHTWRGGWEADNRDQLSVGPDVGPQAQISNYNVLSWPKSSFKFFYNIFGQRNI